MQIRVHLIIILTQDSLEVVVNLKKCSKMTTTNDIHLMTLREFLKIYHDWLELF